MSVYIQLDNYDVAHAILTCYSMSSVTNDGVADNIARSQEYVIQWLTVQEQAMKD